MLFKTIISAIFPNTCACCHTVIDENEFLCDYCMCMLEVCSKDKFCVKCGVPQKECRCKYDVFFFDGIIAPFYRETIAKEIMYELKFRNNPKIARYFAERMALSVKQYYNDINFDVVCCVPMSKQAVRLRGYNQSELIAKELAKILQLPFKANLLLSNVKKRSQYRLTTQQRRENVKGIFYSNFHLTGQRVLLVDDIKTTGATLNECSKVLLGIGADKVYCVTGLVSRKKKKLINPMVRRKEKFNGNRNRN